MKENALDILFANLTNHNQVTFIHFHLTCYTEFYAFCRVSERPTQAFKVARGNFDLGYGSA